MYIKIAENPLKKFRVLRYIGRLLCHVEGKKYIFLYTQCLQKNNFVKMCKLVHFVTLKAP